MGRWRGDGMHAFVCVGGGGKRACVRAHTTLKEVSLSQENHPWY